jgi:hypothetical protein
VADDGIDRISEGTHERFVIDAAKFNSKLAEKIARRQRVNSGRSRIGVGCSAGHFSKSARSGAPPVIPVNVTRQNRVILPR